MSEKSDRAIWVDLKTKQILSTWDATANFKALAIHPRGEWAVLRGSAFLFPGAVFGVN